MLVTFALEYTGNLKTTSTIRFWCNFTHLPWFSTPTKVAISDLDVWPWELLN